jgi:hypothetical protein
MKEDIIALVLGIIFLIVGVVCLVWPERIQEYSLKTTEKSNPFFNWMKTREFVWSLRFAGVVGLLGFVLILIGFIKKD